MSTSSSRLDLRLFFDPTSPPPPLYGGVTDPTLAPIPTSVPSSPDDADDPPGLDGIDAAPHGVCDK